MASLALKAGTASPMLWLLPEQLSKIRVVMRGRRVYLNTDEPGSIYYVEKGSVKIVRISNAGDEVMIERHHAGSLFGNLCFCGGALCREGLEREVAVALEDSRVIITTLDTLKRNIHRCPEKLLALLEDYCRRLAVARTRIESLILQDAEERLARSLLLLTAHQNGGCGSVTLDPPITHEELARWIGVTRPFVTRLMQQLRERGFIETLADGHLLIHRQRIADAYF